MGTATEYRAPAYVGPVDFINMDDLAAQAKNLLPAGGWGYLSGGSGDEQTLRANTEAFQDIGLYPRVLAGIEQPDLKTRFLGIELNSPLIVSPVAAQGLAHQSGEKGSAEGAAAAGSIMCISTYSTFSLEEVAAAGGGAPQFFQLYPSKDSGFNRAILDKAKACGMKAIILTTDATVGGIREADRRNHFKQPLPMGNLVGHSASSGQTIEEIFANAKQDIGLADVEKIAAYTGLPVIVKGIQAAEDAMLAVGAGAAALWVSNHGGRQLDGGPASISVLPEIAEAVDKKVPIIFDSGIRRGQHIIKALASGAAVAAIGRPVLYGLAAGGWQGVKQVFEFFNRELAVDLQLCGCQNIAEARHALLR